MIFSAMFVAISPIRSNWRMMKSNCVECDCLTAAALLHDPLASGAQQMKRLLMTLSLGVLGCGPDTTKSVAELEKLGANIGSF